MTQRKKQKMTQEIRDMDIVDFILIDHKFIKECLKILTNEKADKRKKLSTAKGFLESMHQHSLAEKKAVYRPLLANEELHFTILEAEVEHGIIDQKVKSLMTKLKGARGLKDDIAAELKVLADLVQKHIFEEESHMLPKMREEVDEESLQKIGQEFMKLRKISNQELFNYPDLEEEIIEWKDSVQKMSSRLLSNIEQQVENLKH